MTTRARVSKRIVEAVLLLMALGTGLIAASWWQAHRLEAKFRKAGLTGLLENKPGIAAVPVAGARTKEADLALPTIIEASRAGPTEIRNMACHAMIFFTNRLETVVPVLVAALDDKSVRNQSLSSLRHLGPEAVDMISKMPADSLPIPWEELQFQLSNERRWIPKGSE